MKVRTLEQTRADLDFDLDGTIVKLLETHGPKYLGLGVDIEYAYYPSASQEMRTILEGGKKVQGVMNVLTLQIVLGVKGMALDGSTDVWWFIVHHPFRSSTKLETQIIEACQGIAKIRKGLDAVFN